MTNSKQVKPSELSLDLLIPQSIRGAKPYHGSTVRNTNNSSMHEPPGILGTKSKQSPNLGSFINLRTPKNQAIGILQPIHGTNTPNTHQLNSHHFKKKETNLNDKSFDNIQQSLHKYQPTNQSYPRK